MSTQSLENLALENPHDPYINARAPAVPFEPIRDPAAWTASDLAADDRRFTRCRTRFDR
jgi:hypothetical protein